uniref:Uncharacterized protein n=1 Tax=Ackermannviridae sp. ctUml7 TaxID=2825753 RepID=A0A8S5V9N8_9CAUD|nr:MAG TPA: hypothetical protein [Ackermannviridae sp. ctUml7]
MKFKVLIKYLDIDWKKVSFTVNSTALLFHLIKSIYSMALKWTRS